MGDPQDDLIDHWSDSRHTSERERFVRLLFETSKKKATRITLLTGDVHVAAQGVIESSRESSAPQNSNVITQLVASGIVHPPAAPLITSALNMLAGGFQTVYRGVEGKLVEFWPGGPHLLPKRNWLALVPIEGDSIRAQWHVESLDTQFTKDIGKCV